MKKSLFKTYLLSFLCINFAFLPLKATDLTVGDIIAPGSFIYAGQSPEFIFVIENINVLTAPNYTVTVKINRDGMPIVEEILERNNLAAFSNDTVRWQLENFTVPPGEYEYQIGVSFSDDIDLSNNTKTGRLDVVIGREEAVATFLEILPEIQIDTATTWTFVPQEVLKPGDSLASAEPTEYTAEITNYEWLTWVDLEKDLRYGHKNFYYGINGFTGEIQLKAEVQWYPEINGDPYLGSFTERDTTPDRIIGSSVTPEEVPNTNTVSESAPTLSPDSVCALLVAGKISDDDEDRSFNQDLDFMKKNLMNESLGPRLAENQIITLSNATAKEICDEIEKLNNRYSKVYFYYTGHGNQGWMVTNDSVAAQLGYFDLAKKLYATKAPEICVVLDACYAGSAETRFTWPEEYKSTNLTLVMSCDKDTLSYSKFLFETASGEVYKPGFFTWNFVKCFGDPAANTDSIPEVSIKEAFEWVRKQNPSLSKGPINDVMDPQILVNRVVHPAPEQRTISIPDANTTIHSDSAFDEGTELQVTMEQGIEDSLTLGLDVEYLSRYRSYSLNFKNQFNNLKFSAEFTYDLELDDLPVEENARIGAAELKINTFEAIPSEWNPDKLKVTMDGFGLQHTYGLGITNKAFLVNLDEHGIANIPFKLNQNYPNPFTDQTNISYILSKQANLRLVILNAKGQYLRELFSAFQASGDYKFSWDGKDTRGREMPSGVYFCKIQVGNEVYSKKMLLAR